MSPWELNSGRVIAAVAIFCLVVGIGVWLLSYFQKRLKRDLNATDACEPEDLLASFREAVEDGEMDESEFEKVREALARSSSAISTLQIPPPPADETLNSKDLPA